MKKFISLFVTFSVMCLLIACEDSSEISENHISDEEVELIDDEKNFLDDTTESNEFLNMIVKEFELSCQEIVDEADMVISKLGETYETYDQNGHEVTSFYEHSKETGNALYDTIEIISVNYFQEVSNQGLDDYDYWNDSLDAFYEIWDECMDEFYDTWDDAFDSLYELCDDLIDDGYDTEIISYDEYMSVWSSMYDEYSDAWSTMYQTWSDAWSTIYNYYLGVWSGFNNGESDVDTILETVVEITDESSEQVEDEYTEYLYNETEGDALETEVEDTKIIDDGDITETDISFESEAETKENAVSYSTNDLETAKNGNSGIFSYRRSTGSYDMYYIIDFDEGYVYWFSDGNMDSICEKVAIVSGDLNDVLIITYHDGDATWSYGLHFNWKNQPDTLILQEESGVEYEYRATNLNDALVLREEKTIIEY